ncbi:hypothetical protein [Moritella viscosa]|uniref:Riboflavin biosynthesis protein ribBA-3,4-dihydroxy-2-butanone 4-phosphate synthase-GTP cyclohydrolase-2-GTP cyclohydrolase II n=1 Tax=Moritella viscosa TaxID=80854 RepID=A0A1K9ZFJ0_9GAMM|nr:hypothetical protein [Moritella viscosa]SGY96022.1 Riboflavin biosynthesis protein ribBA-3,4-dihydroxy-2-butanone 4-phosphate synthase-GTP cyclohydrolase-2-GTP cyclohydrolase II [Moritella viscosa]
MKKIKFKWDFTKLFQRRVLENKDDQILDTSGIVTELNDDPHTTRYLITVDSNGTTLETVHVEGKALIDSEAARNLVRDMGQMRGRMDEMIRRMGVLKGACNTERLDKPID